MDDANLNSLGTVEEWGGVRYLNMPMPIDSFDIEGIRALVRNALNPQASELGCVIFPPSSDFRNVLVIFAGNMERFGILSVARHMRCKVVYFQDCHSLWYQGSALLLDVIGLNDFIAHQSGGARLLFFGQSSGGYAALVSAGLVDGAVAIACSPQTFSDCSAKQTLFFAASLKPQYTPEGLIDLRNFLSARTEQKFFALFMSASEWSNPCDAYVWCDWLHSPRLAGLPNVSVYVTNTARHPLVSHRTRQFSELVENIMASENHDERLVICKTFADSLSEATYEGEVV